MSQMIHNRPIGQHSPYELVVSLLSQAYSEHFKCCHVSIVYLSSGDIKMRDASVNLRAHVEQRDLIDQAARLLGKKSFRLHA